MPQMCPMMWMYTSMIFKLNYYMILMWMNTFPLMLPMYYNFMLKKEMKWNWKWYL